MIGNRSDDPPGELSALIQAARNGDVEALDLLLDASRSALRQRADATFPRDLQTRIDPSDVIQEAMLDASRDFAQFQGRNSVEWQAWLNNILSCNVIDQMRKHIAAERRSVHREQPASTDESTGPGNAAFVAADSTPSNRAMRNDIGEWLTKLQARLSPEHRQVLQLRFWQDKTLPEIAALINKSPWATSRLLRRAIGLLRKLAVEQAETDDPA